MFTAIDGNNPVVVILDAAAGDVFAASMQGGWTWTFSGGGTATTRQSLSGYNVAVNHQVAIHLDRHLGLEPRAHGHDLMP